MSEGSISQEEIDALLSGVDMGGLGAGGSFSSGPDASIDTATLQKFADAMKGKLSTNLKDFQVEKLLMHYFAGEPKLTNWKSRLREFLKLFWAQNHQQDAGGLVK